ncbi:flavin reductase family protein [Streptomyces yaizuensis]|uniref:Flavin reductase family protein n=1 Tax=Streptomyces yaizuensis TaxID=2989713 RepID=A0ABQ5P3V0_9ACTN|nr:flavin reductase family protein [Streptomyces sp. YSPA8]GLF97259.1 flavin reductase family protein [Streptomyces sp. YSPA8]
MGHAAMAETAVRFLRSRGDSAPGTATPEAPAGAVPYNRSRLRAVAAQERAPVDPVEFRRVLGCFPTGVTVVTSRDADGPAGFACQSFSSLSLDPPLVVFMVARTSATWPRIARAGVFCVNVLGAEQDVLCRGFAMSGAGGADKFAGVDHRPAPVTGSPLLVGARAWVDCTVHAVHPGGDHLIVVGRVAALGTPEGEGDGPLVFHRGAFRRLAAASEPTGPA